MTDTLDRASAKTQLAQLEARMERVVADVRASVTHAEAHEANRLREIIGCLWGGESCNGPLETCGDGQIRCYDHAIDWDNTRDL